jgi:predicted Fe-Mo cluster-binding NifX family protein
MKIAIATDDGGKTIASHFGRTKGFIIYTVKGSNIQSEVYKVNDFTGHARGTEKSNHNIDRHGPILMALNDCDLVIAHGMGQRIYKDLKNSGIQSLITSETNTRNAITSYLNRELVDYPKRGCLHKH